MLFSSTDLAKQGWHRLISFKKRSSFCSFVGALSMLFVLPAVLKNQDRVVQVRLG
jgi:hypothetical protein